jgi:hypothetical protein
MTTTNQPVQLCFCEGCETPTTHKSDYHVCMLCGLRGHGIFECGNEKKISELLIKSKKITIPKEHQCKYNKCRFKTTHTMDSHVCSLCFDCGHELTCNTQHKSVKSDKSVISIIHKSKKQLIRSASRRFGNRSQSVYTRYICPVNGFIYVKRSKLGDRLRFFHIGHNCSTVQCNKLIRDIITHSRYCY